MYYLEPNMLSPTLIQKSNNMNLNNLIKILITSSKKFFRRTSARAQEIDVYAFIKTP